VPATTGPPASGWPGTAGLPPVTDPQASSSSAAANRTCSPCHPGPASRPGRVFCLIAAPPCSTCPSG